MGACTNLATKPELNTKISKSEEPAIVEKAALAGSAIAVSTLNPTIRGVIDDIASIGAKVGGLISKVGIIAGEVAGLLGKISGILSLLASLASVAMVIALQIEVAKLNARVSRLDLNLQLALADIGIARQKANEAKREANKAVEKANTAIAVANNTVITANNAYSAATEAQRKSLEAISDARDAVTKSNTATQKANTATADANNAVKEANQAKIEAKDAIAKANNAITISNKNAQELVDLKVQNQQLKTEIQQLKEENRRLTFQVERLDFDLRYLKSSLEAAQEQVENKEDKVVVRRVEQAVVTNASGIRDLDGKLVGIPSYIGTRVSEFETTLTKTFNKKLERTKDEIKTLVGGVSVAQAKEIAKTEVNTRVGEYEKLNNDQYNGVKDLLKDLPVVVAGTVGLGLTSTWNRPGTRLLDDIHSQTTPASITSAAAAGVCQTTAPGGCANQNLGNLFNNNANSLINAAGTSASVANNALLLAIQRTVNQTYGIVSHARHGLQSMQSFAETAWKATRADKIMSAITTVVVLHNAMMISGNLASTISEAINLGLQALGIKDETDTPINIGASVKAKLNEMLVSILGEEQAKALTTRIAAANRVYQASANVYNLVREIGDTARNIAEVTAENTGKIGNALLDAGAVFDDAYDKMVDNVNPQSKAQMKLEKFRNGAEVLENASEAISEISSSVIEIKDLKTELEEGKTKLDEARTAFKATMDTEKETTKTESSAETDVNKADFEVSQKDVI